MSRTKTRLVSDREIIKKFREETGYRGGSWRSTICPDPVKWPQKSRSLKKKGEDVIALDFDWIEGEEENFLNPDEAERLVESLSDWYSKLKVIRKQKSERRKNDKEIKKLSDTVKEEISVETNIATPPAPPVPQEQNTVLPRPETPPAPPVPPRPTKELEERKIKQSEEYYKKVREDLQNKKENPEIKPNIFVRLLRALGLK